MSNELQEKLKNIANRFIVNTYIDLDNRDTESVPGKSLYTVKTSGVRDDINLLHDTIAALDANGLSEDSLQYIVGIRKDYVGTSQSFRNNANKIQSEDQILLNKFIDDYKDNDYPNLSEQNSKLMHYLLRTTVALNNIANNTKYNNKSIAAINSELDKIINLMQIIKTNNTPDNITDELNTIKGTIKANLQANPWVTRFWDTNLTAGMTIAISAIMILGGFVGLSLLGFVAATPLFLPVFIGCLTCLLAGPFPGLLGSVVANFFQASRNNIHRQFKCAEKNLNESKKVVTAEPISAAIHVQPRRSVSAVDLTGANVITPQRDIVDDCSAITLTDSQLDQERAEQQKVGAQCNEKKRRFSQ